MLDDKLARTAERLGFKLGCVLCGRNCHAQSLRSMRPTTPCHLTAASPIAPGQVSDQLLLSHMSHAGRPLLLAGMLQLQSADD